MHNLPLVRLNESSITEGSLFILILAPSYTEYRYTWVFTGGNDVKTLLLERNPPDNTENVLNTSNMPWNIRYDFSSESELHVSVRDSVSREENINRIYYSGLRDQSGDSDRPLLYLQRQRTAAGRLTNIYRLFVAEGQQGRRVDVSSDPELSKIAGKERTISIENPTLGNPSVPMPITLSFKSNDENGNTFTKIIDGPGGDHKGKSSHVLADIKGDIDPKSVGKWSQF